MNHPNWIYSVSIAVLCAYGVVASHAAQNAPTFMSKDGQIQSVNKYSSNPFWSPNSPYNQRIPTPIYATGPDLTTGDCNTVVKTLVASHCAARNNCTDLRISDVRPNIMVQLSQLPGHSYATSCGGYIDSAFENYKKTYGNVSAVNIVYSGNNKANNTLRLTPATYTLTETETRAAELERLQKETTPDAGIDATLFPKTVDDLSFTDRLANTTVGYEPYKNLESYKTPKFETETEYYERMKPLLEHQITYVNAGAANGCPKTYLTGRGTTVSCVPTRDPRSEFVAWCMDAKLTNCAQEYIISPTDRDDKVFYAKWDCISNSVKHGDKCECTDPHMNQYCECTGIYKPDPSDATRCACVNGENPANNCDTPQITPPSPSTCPDPIMDSANNCACPTGTNNTANPNKCECNNGKSNPPTCDGGTPPHNKSIPQCLTKMSTDGDFTNTVLQQLGSSTNINLQELRNRQVLPYIAQNVYNFCVDSDTVSATDFAEFNTWLDTEDSIPVIINNNNIDINAEELFNYTDYSYVVIAIQKNIFQLQSTINRNDVTYLPEHDTCARYYGPGPLTPYDCISVVFGQTPSITTAAKNVYGNHIYNLNKSPVWGFPGTLVYGKNGSCDATIVRMRNYKIARQKIKALVANLNSASGCSGLGMVLYLVNPKSASYNNNKITEVIIKSEPFFVQ